MLALIVAIETSGGFAYNFESYFTLADDEIDVFLPSVPDLLLLDLVDVDCEDQLDHDDNQIDKSLANERFSNANPVDLENI